MKNQISKFNRSYTQIEGFTFQSFTQLSPEQIELVCSWRNNPAIREWMYNSRAIQWEDHLQYINQLEHQDKKFYWLVSNSAHQFGVIHIVYGEQEVEWGFYLNPEFLGSGMGVELIFHSLNFLFKSLDIKQLFSFIRMKNSNVLMLHDLFEIKEDGLWQFYPEGQSQWFYKRTITNEEWLTQITSLKAIKKRLVEQADELKRIRIEQLSSQLWVINSLNPQ